MIRILLADDHEIVRCGLRDILGTRLDWDVCAEAGDGREAVEMALRLRPDVALLDLTMPALNGIEATRQIRRELPGTEVLVFTMHQSEQLAREVLQAGARGYLLKSAAARQLVPAVEAIARHRPFLTGRVGDTAVEESVPSGHWRLNGAGACLTAREREIVQLLAEGGSNKEVAFTLGISVKTVETHRAAVMRKLRLRSFAELVLYAVRNTIVLP